MNDENINIDEQLNILEETKVQIKQAIIDKGQSVSSDDSFRSYATKIGNIEVLNTQSKTVTPTTSQQLIEPDQQYNALSSVTVNAVTSAIDNNIQTGNIKSGATILGVSGKFSVVDTSDANALADDIINDKTAYVNGQKVTGTLEIADAVSINNSDNTDTNLMLMDVGDIPSVVVGADINDLYGVKEVVEDGVGLEIIAPQSQFVDFIGLTTDKIKLGETILGVVGSVVELNGDTETVTPTTSQQIITPTSPKNGFTQVTVNPVTSAIDNNIQAQNIKDGVEILGVTGTFNPYQMREYASETEMNNDITNIQEGEVVKVVTTPIVFSDNNTYTIPEFSVAEGKKFFVVVRPDLNKLWICVYDSQYTLKQFYTNYPDGRPSITVYDGNEIAHNKVDYKLYDNYPTNITTYTTGNTTSFSVESVNDIVIFYTNEAIYDTNNVLIYEPANDVTTFYVKETTMKKLVKEEDTLSPAEAQQAEVSVDNLLGEGENE